MKATSLHFHIITFSHDYIKFKAFFICYPHLFLDSIHPK